MAKRPSRKTPKTPRRAARPATPRATRSPKTGPARKPRAPLAATRPSARPKAAPTAKPLRARPTPRLPAKATAAPAHRPARAVLLGELAARQIPGPVEIAPHAAGFLVGWGWHAEGAAPFTLRTVYALDNLGATHRSAVAAASFAIAARPTAPDGQGFAALAAFEDELGEIVASPLSFDGMSVQTHRLVLSSPHTTAADPAAAASRDRFWVAYQTAGARIEVHPLRPDLARAGATATLNVPQGDGLSAHRRPRLCAAYDGVGVSFTVSAVGAGGGAYFAFLDEAGHASPLVCASEVQGDTCLSRAGGGFVLTVQRPGGTFDVVGIAPEASRAGAWRHEPLAAEVPGRPIAISAGEVLAVESKGSVHAVTRRTLDGKARGTIRLAFPILGAGRGRAGWLLALAEGRAVLAIELPAR